MSADLGEHLQKTLGTTYSIERELGSGGMSRVFAAEERALGRRVVVKVLPPELGGAVSADRFRREVHLAARLQHPHIVPLLSAGEADGVLYYTMPFVEGESLRTRLVREGELPVPDAVRILRDVARALACAHRHGVVHRDVKPENILLGEDGALVTDFGVAKALGEAAGSSSLTATGVALGTPSYMAPEQVAADPHTDQRADVYALGAVAYEMLTGQPPFTGSSPQQVLAAHSTRAPEPLPARRPRVPPALAALVMRCLEKRPADRPQTADEVLRELEALATLGEMNSSTGRARSAGRALAYVGMPAALLVGVVAYALLARRPEGRADVGPAAAKSIAVLPFVNLSPDRENEYFSDGMTEELINALSKIEGLRVVSRASAFAFKGKTVATRQVGERLKVGTVLQGSVRRAGNRLRISAQLVDAADDVTLWSEAYDGEVQDVFAVQEGIARAIVGALQVRLTGRTAGDIVHQPTDDLEAYELYLKGRFAWNQRTARSIQDAIGYFERAIDKDSTFALAYVGMADAYAILPTYAFTPPGQASRQAKAAALRALQLDSTLAEAYATLGSVRIDEYDWAGAEDAFKRAIAANPRYATAHHWYALALVCMGRFAEARAEADRALALDPSSRVIGMLPAAVRYYERDYGGAVARLRRILEADPNYGGAHQWLALALAQQGKTAEAAAEARETSRLHRWRPGVLGGYLAYIHALAGNRAEAHRELEELLRRSRTEYVPETVVAAVYAAFGDADRAFVWLERAVDVNAPEVQYIKVDPRFDPLRSDRRFALVLKRMRLQP